MQYDVQMCDKSEKINFNIHDFWLSLNKSTMSKSVH